MKWIKASERLPEGENRKVIRRDPQYGNQVKEVWSHTLRPFQYWLDESEPASQPSAPTEAASGVDRCLEMAREILEVTRPSILRTASGEWEDLQQQAKDHISGYIGFDWDEALTGFEMDQLIDLLMTFSYKPPKSHASTPPTATPEAIKMSEVEILDMYSKMYELQNSDEMVSKLVAIHAMQLYAEQFKSKPLNPTPEAARIEEVLNEKDGYWHSCTGCYETEDGHPVGDYAYNEVYKCAVGSGCGECGGIGVVWDQFRQPEAAKEPDPFIEKHMAAIRHKYMVAAIDTIIQPMFGGLEAASIQHFLETGKISGSFWQRLQELYEAGYNRGTLSLPASTALNDGWIRVSDELPETNEKFGESDYVLVMEEGNNQTVAWYNKKANEWRVSHHSAKGIAYVTHWQPLPTPPKK